MLRVFTAFSGYDSQCMALDVIHEHSKEPNPWHKLHGRKNAKYFYFFNYDLVGWSEIDKFAIKAHNVLFPQWADRNYGDISKIDWSQVPDFDLFTYSSPCQDFSQAGMQRGATKGSGTRSSLLWECERAIAAKRPKYLLFENVAAVVSKKFIKLFNEWQLTLERMGYSNFVQVLNAKSHGYPTPVPQNRERVFMVSILDCQEPYYFPEAQPLRQRLLDVLEQDVPDEFYLSAERVKNLVISTKKESERGNGFEFSPKTGDDIANTITGNAGGRKTDNFIMDDVQVIGNLQPDNMWGNVVRQQNFVIGTDGVSMAITAKHNMHPFKIAEVHPGQNGAVYDTDGVAPTICAAEGYKTNTKIAILGWSRDDKGNVLNRHPVDVANCVTDVKRENMQNYVINGMRIRKLTPRECFRLMGVSDADIDRLQASGISKSQQYKLSGNSIVVNCLAAIFRQLFVGNFNKYQQSEIFN